MGTGGCEDDVPSNRRGGRVTCGRVADIMDRRSFISAKSCVSTSKDTRRCCDYDGCEYCAVEELAAVDFFELSLSYHPILHFGALDVCQVLAQ